MSYFGLRIEILDNHLYKFGSERFDDCEHACEHKSVLAVDVCLRRQFSFFQLHPFVERRLSVYFAVSLLELEAKGGAISGSLHLSDMTFDFCWTSLYCVRNTFFHKIPGRNRRHYFVTEYSQKAGK